MKNSTSILFTLLVLALFGCKTEQVVIPTKPVPVVVTGFVDVESPSDAAPFLLGDSLMQTKKNWKLAFSDEFNDNQMNPLKWTIENTIKYRSDVTLYANSNQVEEKSGKAFLYYQKSSLHDSAYFAGRMNSKGKFATTYGYFECRNPPCKTRWSSNRFLDDAQYRRAYV